VATLIARGLSNRQIADELVVSERTVEWHVDNLLGELGLETKARLVVWTREHGLSAAN
jgi:DNA-binding NarL/FixJ family response regulator